MFDNVLHQSACDLLSDDIARDKLPGAILFSGPAASGKFTCALELARVLSCRGSVRGAWNCTCPSCLKHKALVSTNVLAVGPGNRTLEIAAARATLLAQNANNTNHLEAARYLYLRAVRKLTIRFSPILWEGDDKLSKFSPILQSIDENLEVLEPGRVLPDGDELVKILDEIGKLTEKLEGSYLYDSLPVSQIRTFSSWARLSSSSGKRVLIIENADRMADSARNALLKILEEPPSDTMFILTTSRRGAVLPTILSRVRTYVFFERSREHQQEVIDRVFHYDPGFGNSSRPETINDFLQTYLPVQPDYVRHCAREYFDSIAQGHVPDVPSVVNSCGGFEPRVLFRLFLEGIVLAQRHLLSSAAGAAASSKIVGELRRINNNVCVYNQNPASALEELARTLLQIQHVSGGIFKEQEQ